MLNHAEMEALHDELGAELGDPRRCPIHGCVTSSPDGLHDAPCGGCEAEMDEEPRAPNPFDWAWWLDFGVQNPPRVEAPGDDEILF